METNTRKPLSTAGTAILNWLDQHRDEFPTNREFAFDCGFSEPTFSRILRGQPTPDQALAMHRVSKGRLSAHITRPDYWPTAEAVPVPPAEAAQC